MASPFTPPPPPLPTRKKIIIIKKKNNPTSFTPSPPKPKKISLNKHHYDTWINKGNVIPTCINQGCNNTVAIRHWSAQGDPSLKTECSKCSDARTKHKIIHGVTFHKKTFCENKDGILGFLCPLDQTRYSEFSSDIYHMDHLDGNHHNNIQDNIKTFCSICHTRKGKEHGDFNAYKSSSRLFKI